MALNRFELPKNKDKSFLLIENMLKLACFISGAIFKKLNKERLKIGKTSMFCR
jgi:hypothetical protein